jgi:hypothetical protein
MIDYKRPTQYMQPDYSWNVQADPVYTDDKQYLGGNNLRSRRGLTSSSVCGGGGGGCAKYAVTNPDKSSVRVVVPNIPPPCRLAAANKDSSDKDIIALVKVYDMGGRLLVNRNFSNAKKADIVSGLLIPGVYIIEISDGKDIERQKLVVVR